ncbi:gamma-glutamyltranspeptidase / glutathione hydrolase [Rhodoferax sp. OV413]|uniref:gamma-glutamyltransferase n=1 Tax=Rhodoferax sp. OV413 TaxID=1855285 RepID=UPI00087FEE62|nr:gamma-glutamyltransferase [Rhodoferax sp. OV413]SDP88742.1 gamma-glutamyltranspeptidase / glutathione hydrolase [Rhodoferax sp. OV413]
MTLCTTSTVTSTKGMVTSPHALATQAGLDVLARGGNAIEAAIAITACLCVTYPHFAGLGGDAFMLIADKTGQVQTLSGIGQAPQHLPHYSGSIPVRGPQAMLTSAALVDVLGQAYGISHDSWAGQHSWQQLLEPAIGFARDGFAMSDSERFWLDMRLPDAANLPDIYANFLVNGEIPAPHSVRQQHPLASTLETLAARGPRDFYEGQLASRVAKGLAQAGSPLTAADLAQTRARVEAPLRTAYRGGTLLAHRPPTQGITTLEIMGILQRFDLRSIPEGSADYYHLLVEAVKQAFIDRNRHVADPEQVEVPIERLLSAAHLDHKAQQIRMDQALPWPHPFQTGDTVYIAATDSAGNAVSMLATIYFDWGSGVLVGDTGLLWHNRGSAFSLDPKHPNCLAPGKRPFHTLNPGMYLQNGKPTILYGTQGADGQPQTLAAILTRMIDYGMDPYTALARPRFLLGKTFSDARDSLKVEEDVPEDVFAELARRGHALSPIPAQSPLMGHPGAIRIDPVTGSMQGAHDPRSDGRAMGLPD